MPTIAGLWDVFVDAVGHKLEVWQKIIPNFTYDPELPFFEMLVPTIDTIRYGHIMERLIYINHPVLLTGDTGIFVLLFYSDVNVLFFKGLENRWWQKKS